MGCAMPMRLPTCAPQLRAPASSSRISRNRRRATRAMFPCPASWSSPSGFESDPHGEEARPCAPPPDDALHRRENHEARPVAFILRDAASRLLRMGGYDGPHDCCLLTLSPLFAGRG